MFEEISLTGRDRYTAFRNPDTGIQYVLRRLRFHVQRRSRYLDHFCYFVNLELCRNLLQQYHCVGSLKNQIKNELFLFERKLKKSIEWTCSALGCLLLPKSYIDVTNCCSLMRIKANQK